MAERTFEDKPAVRGTSPLLIGITGVSSSGKTFSALRLATGIQRVTGGEIFVIDTERERATHYANRFKFRHVNFEPPFGPLDYKTAIDHCVRKGAKVIVVDSMSHEHSGEGGVMDQSDKWLDAKCGDDWRKRQKNLMLSLVEPKRQRKILNAYIARLGVSMILCYRAADKIKPVQGEEPVKLGWQPETTSPLHYEMTQRFLLLPGAAGVPTLHPEHEAERLSIKTPEQFKGWFKEGEALSEALGERMARWAYPNTEPTFRTGKDWSGKPLASAPTDVLTKYRGACEEVLAKKQGTAADDMRAHIAEIDAVLGERMRSESSESRNEQEGQT